MKIDENYDGPKREKTSRISQFGYHCKRENGAWNKSAYLHIKGYLKKNVGRCWNDIYSELCHIYRRKWDRKFLDDTLEYKVDLHSNSRAYVDYYVSDGILHYKRREPCKPISIEQLRWLKYKIKHSHGRIFAQIKGIWYELFTKKYTTKYTGLWLRPIIEDIFLGDNPTEWTRNFCYGNSSLVCYKKQQLNSKEIQDFGL